MTYLLSFVKGLIALVATLIMVYYGLRLLDRWNKGFKGLVAMFLVFPPVLFLAAYAADLLTLGKLGDFGSILVTILVLMVVGGLYKIRKELREIAELQDVAAALGLKFYRTLEVDPTLGDHPLLKRGFFPTVDHALVGRYKDVDTLMFNFGYEDISDDTPDHYLRTAVVFTDPDMKVPEFELRSAGIGHRMFGSLFGGHSIEVPQDPEFSKQYRLTGPDPRAVRALFGHADRRALKRTKRRWAMSGKDHQVVMYADAMMDEEVKPELEEISKYLGETWTLFAAVRSAAPG